MRARASLSTRKAVPRPKAARPPARTTRPSGQPGRKEKSEVRIFVSYSHMDADARRKLETHLAPLKGDNVSTWFDGDMNAGDKLDTAIARALRNAHVFVGLLSPDYLASHYCWKIEYRRAMNRRARGTMRVVAVVVRPCDWKSTPAAGFKLLPEDGREVTRWRSADAAYLNVAQDIRRVVAAVRREIAAASQPAKPKRAAAKATAKAAAKGSAPPKAKKPRARANVARKPSKAGTKT